MSKKILVTGGAGFIGTHLVNELLKKGHAVTVFDNLDPQVHGQNPDLNAFKNKDFAFIKGDVRDRDSLLEVIKDSEIIFHEAAIVGVGQSMYEVARYTDHNVMGTAVLLDILANEKHSVEKLLVASSMSIYGEGKYHCEKCGVVNPKLRSISQLKNSDWEMKCPFCGFAVEKMPADEEKPLFPTSVYAISKRDQEEMCLTVGRAYSIPTVALRYFNVYGPGQALSNPYTGVAAIFSSRLINNHQPYIFEDGLQSRDFTHVSDIVQANILAMEREEANYDMFNVGTGRSSSVLEVAKTLIKELDVSIEPDVVNRYREGDIRHCYGDITKIRKKLGYEPKVSFEEGVHDLVEWVREQEVVDQFDKTNKELSEKGLVL